MSEMVERVARALHALPSERWSEVPWDELQTQERDRLLYEARAAIKAMREPTEDMICEGEKDEYTVQFIWYHMIDAALSRT